MDESSARKAKLDARRAKLKAKKSAKKQATQNQPKQIAKLGSDGKVVIVNITPAKLASEKSEVDSKIESDGIILDRALAKVKVESVDSDIKEAEKIKSEVERLKREKLKIKRLENNRAEMEKKRVSELKEVEKDKAFCEVSSKMNENGKERTAASLNWALLKSKTSAGLGTMCCEVIQPLGCVVRQTPSKTSLKVSFESMGTLLHILHTDSEDLNRVLVQNRESNIIGWASLSASNGSVSLKKLNPLTAGVRTFLKKNRRVNTAINCRKGGCVDEAIEGLKEVLVSRGVNVDAPSNPELNEIHLTSIIQDGSITDSTPIKSHKKYKTRKEAINTWLPSPLKSSKLSCMYRGVPIDVKQSSIISSRPKLSSPLRSDDILNTLISSESEIRNKSKKLTSQPSSTKTRRYVDFIVDARVKHDTYWMKKDTEKREREEEEVRRKEVEVFHLDSPSNKLRGSEEKVVTPLSETL